MTTRTLHRSLRWRHKPFPELVRLAWPIAVSTLSYSAMTLVDTLFVGRLGASALAGVGVGGVHAFTLLCFGFGLLRSVKVVVSQSVGLGRHDRIPGFISAGLVLALALGLANVVLGWLSSPYLSLITKGAEAGQLAAGYVDVRVLGAPLALAAIALREARYGTGDSRSPMRATVAANLANVALDYLFIFQLDLGVRGAAAASVIAHGVDLAILLWAQRSIGRGLARPSWTAIRRIWSVGVPLGLQMLMEVSAFALLTAIFASMGEVQVAAHQITLQVAHLSFLPALALGEAASVMAGQAIGARALRLVPRLARIALAAAAVYTGLCGLAFFLFAESIAGAFSSDPELVSTTVTLLWVAAAFQVFDGANIVARCVLRGTGDVRFPALVSVSIAWLVTPAAAFGLGIGLGMGVLGGWLGICLEIGLGAGVLWWRLARGGWLSAARRSRADLKEPTGVVAAAA